MGGDRYQLCGVGNALVDSTAYVTEDFLLSLPMPKGAMRLVSAQEQAKIVALLKGTIPLTQCTGGAVANTMVSFAQWRGKAAYNTCVAKDDSGEHFVKTLKEAGLATHAIRKIDTTLPTGSCLVLVTPDGERTLCSCLGVATQFSVSHVALDTLSHSEWTYIEGYLASTAPGYSAMQLAQATTQKKGGKVALSLSDSHLVKQHTDAFLGLLEKGIDLLFCNKEEALALTGETHIAAAAHALRHRVRTAFVITCGAEGAWIGDDTHLQNIACYPADAINTNGAGDAFAAAFLYAIIVRKSSHKKAGTWAARVAAALVTKTSATFTQAEATTLQKKNWQD